MSLVKAKLHFQSSGANKMHAVAQRKLLH